MRKNDYGPKGDHNQAMGDMYLPGSPDARARSGDMYDRMSPISGYGKKVTTTKNKTGSGATNTGIQGSAERGNSKATQDKSEKVSGTAKRGSISYGKVMGNQLDNSVTESDSYDYAKGRNKKGDKRQHVKAQEA